MEDKIFNFLINYFSNINDRGVDEMNNFRGDITSDEIIEWLKNIQTSSEQPSEDLEKETESYLITNRQYAGGSEEDLWGDDCIRNAIKHGANWQKEQMIRAAIDALVDEDAENVGKKTLLLIGEQRDALNTQLSNYEYGETVKLVVIKEEK